MLVIVLSAVVLALSAHRPGGRGRDLMKGGQGYASFKWYDSEAMEFLRMLPEGRDDLHQ